MTKDQKVENIAAIVKEARRFYSMAEFTDMVERIWQGLDSAKVVAVEPAAGGGRDSIS